MWQHAYGWGGRSDEEILEDVLSVLSKMFDVSELPDLIDYKITHWDTDPFSMGSYSFMGMGSTTVCATACVCELSVSVLRITS